MVVEAFERLVFVRLVPERVAPLALVLERVVPLALVLERVVPLALVLERVVPLVLVLERVVPLVLVRLVPLVPAPARVAFDVKLVRFELMLPVPVVRFDPALERLTPA